MVPVQNPALSGLVLRTSPLAGFVREPVEGLWSGGSLCSPPVNLAPRYARRETRLTALAPSGLKTHPSEQLRCTLMKLVDILILLGYLLGTLALGWYFRKGRRDNVQHFLAGRQMGILPIGLSIMVTSFSAVNFIAIPDEVASYGLYVVLSFPVFFIVAWPISKIWMPFFNKLQATTAYEFLEQRFSRRVRLVASGLFLFWRFAWMGLALFVSGKILAAFTGYNPLMLVAICGIGATLYTCLGGMKAVMWTDVLQFFVLMTGIGLCLYFAVEQAPGTFWTAVVEGGRLKPYLPFDACYFSVSPTERMSFFSVLIGTFVTFMTRYGADQVVMQRYFTAKNLQKAQRGIWLNAAMSCLALGLLTLLGLALFSSAPDKAIAGSGFALKQLAQMSRSFPAGAAGLLISGILAATMSSVDSGLNSCSASLVTDFRLKCPNALLTLGCGAVITWMAIVVFPPLNQHQSIFAIINRFVNGIGSPLLAIVMLGMFARRLRESSVFYGAIAGIGISLMITVFVPHLALHYYAVLNFAVTVICCLCAKLIVQK